MSSSESDTTFAVTDPEGITIDCPLSRWRVITTKHPEMENQVESVKSTIRNPKEIFKSNTHPDGRVYEGEKGFLGDPSKHLRISVKCKGWEALLATAFAEKNPYTGDKIWPK